MLVSAWISTVLRTNNPLFGKDRLFVQKADGSVKEHLLLKPEPPTVPAPKNPTQHSPPVLQICGRDAEPPKYPGILTR